MKHTITTRFLPAMMAAILALPLPVHAAKDPWRPLDTSRGRPTEGSLTKNYIGPSQDGQYQLRLIGTKFAAVFTAEGAPLVVFDLSLHTLTWQERILGALGFGDMSVWKLIKGLKKKKSAEKKANNPESENGETDLDLADEDFEDDASAMKALSFLAKFAGEDDSASEGPLSEKDRQKFLKRGQKLFKKLRFNDEWARRRGLAPASNGKGHEFQLSDFNVSDIHLEKESDRRLFNEPFLRLARLLYPDQEWNDENIRDFMAEMEFRFDPAKPGYDLVWNIAARKSKRVQPLPGIVANFIDPYANLVYKHSLRQFDQYGENLIRQLGTAGIVMDLVISRMVHGLSERLDYHERQFLGLLEATQRFEYASDLPIELVDVMTDLVYLSYYEGGGDPDIGDAVAKRKRVLSKQERMRPMALDRIKHLDKTKSLRFQDIANGKFTIAWAQKPGEEVPTFRGIYGLALKPTRFLKRPSLHVHPSTSGWKMLERYSAEIMGFAARALIPGQFGLRIGSLGIGISIPPAVYQHWIRTRSLDEMQIEGELVGLVDEAVAGRLQLPLSQQQLLYVQKHLRSTFANPYELSLAEEPSVIERNLRRVKQVLAGEKALLHDAKMLVPYSM